MYIHFTKEPDPLDATLDVLIIPYMFEVKRSESRLVMSNFATTRAIACQTPLFMEFSKQKYWSEYPFPSPGYLPNPGIEPGSAVLQVDSLPFEPTGKPPIFFYGQRACEILVS